MRYMILLMILSSVAQAKVTQTIEQAAKLAGVNPKLLLAVCFVESSWRDNLKPRMDGETESHGVCQVKLETALYMDTVFKHRIKASAKRLQSTFLNAFYAAKVLKWQLTRYKGNLRKAIEAYNKGNAVNNGHGEYVNKVFKALTLVAQN